MGVKSNITLIILRILIYIYIYIYIYFQELISNKNKEYFLGTLIYLFIFY
jgi:hypothetical protein